MYRAVRLLGLEGEENQWAVFKANGEMDELVSSHKTRREARVKAKELNTGGENERTSGTEDDGVQGSDRGGKGGAAGQAGIGVETARGSESTGGDEGV